MYRFAIVLILMCVLLTACGSEVTKEVSSTSVQIETVDHETPKDTKTPSQPSSQDKSTKITPTVVADTPIIIQMDHPYLMAFHACDSFNLDCHDPRNHKVYLAGAEDVETWNLIDGWVPIQGSVPDLIRRGDTLYVYTGPWLVRYHFDTGLIDEPTQVEISPGEGMDPNEPIMLTDVSLIKDDKDRLVMFFLFGKMGSDPAMCSPGESTCSKRIGSATEVEGSDGGAFVVNVGERISAEIGEGKAFMSLSDPDIFTDGQDFYLLLSHGSWISVWTSPEMHGIYKKLDVQPMGFLSTGSGGVASGYYHPDEGRFWIFSHVHLDEGMVIRLAVAKDLTRQLEEGAWTKIISGEEIGLGPGYNIESPGFSVNKP